VRFGGSEIGTGEGRMEIMRGGRRKKGRRGFGRDLKILLSYGYSICAA
jgi:hypothetical protein